MARSDQAGDGSLQESALDALPSGATATETNASAPPSSAAAADKWPGWPGDSVFRLIVPVLKVGSIIGRKGEYVKKMCEETGARIRILEGVLGTSDRVVLIFGKEEPDAKMSPAMDAVIRVFKRINGLPEGDSAASVSIGVPTAMCSIRLLVPSTQATHLIGKQGKSIKSIQENTGSLIRVLSGDEVPFYAAADEKIVDIQGFSSNVLKGLENVVAHLRKFLVDRSIIPLFEKNYSATSSQDRAAAATDSWAEKTESLAPISSQTVIGNDYPLSLKRDTSFLDHETRSGVALYGQDPLFSRRLSSGFGRTSFVTQVTQTMQIPLSYADDIIGVGGANIAYIRRTSGATVSLQETRGILDEITVEIKGTSSEVQTAQQLIQESLAGHKEPAASSYSSKLDSGLGSYSQFSNTSYPSLLSSQSLGRYGSSGIGAYGSYRF